MFGRLEEAGLRRPHGIVAHSDPGYTMAAVRAFRRNGWMFTLAANGPEARRLASASAADLVVLEADWIGIGDAGNVGRIHRPVITQPEMVAAGHVKAPVTAPHQLLEPDGIGQCTFHVFALATV